MNHQKLVKTFMEQINQLDDKIDINDINNKDLKSIKLRLTLMLEKTQDLFDSFLTVKKSDFVYNPLFNILKKQIDDLTTEDIEINQENVAQYLADYNYINYGTAVFLNIPLDKCFEEIHKSNMTKITSFTGNPIYREDGKLLYDFSYVPPNIKNVLERNHNAYIS